jgi:hypothetical protein
MLTFADHFPFPDCLNRKTGEAVGSIFPGNMNLCLDLTLAGWPEVVILPKQVYLAAILMVPVQLKQRLDMVKCVGAVSMGKVVRRKPMILMKRTDWAVGPLKDKLACGVHNRLARCSVSAFIQQKPNGPFAGIAVLAGLPNSYAGKTAYGAAVSHYQQTAFDHLMMSIVLPWRRKYRAHTARIDLRRKGNTGHLSVVERRDCGGHVGFIMYYFHSDISLHLWSEAGQI